MVKGVDPSVGMLTLGREKVRAAAMEDLIELAEGDAQKLEGVQDDSFEKITMSFGIRNVEDREAALREMWRVSVKSNDTVIAIMEVGLPTSGILRSLAHVLASYVVPAIGKLTSGLKEEYTHLQKSLIEFPSPEEFSRLMHDCGLVVYEVRDIAFSVIRLYLAHPRLPPPPPPPAAAVAAEANDGASDASASTS